MFIFEMLISLLHKLYPLFGRLGLGLGWWWGVFLSQNLAVFKFGWKLFSIFMGVILDLIGAAV